MAKEVIKNGSQQVAHHHVEANEVVGSVVSKMETTTTVIKPNYQC